MSLQWPAPIYTDGDFTVAAACSLPVFSSPIPATTKEYVFTQEFMQFRANFAALALDTAHPSAGLLPDYSSFLLVSEGERRDAGNGIVRWTRTYALTPDAYDDFESFAYNWIGYTGLFVQIGQGYINPAAATGRPRRTQVVTSRVNNEFFRTATPSSITIIKGQRYTYTGAGGAVYDTEALADAQTLNGVSIGASSPTLTAYLALVAGGAGLGTGAANGEFVAEDSRLTRWMGNIWLRQTRYVVAI